MFQRLRNRQGGFTLIELLIVVAIIGIIAAILIPNLLDALQKAKQKSTMSEERTYGTAMFSWIGDMTSAAAAGRGATADDYDLPDGDLTHAQIVDILVSPDNDEQSYLQDAPRLDGWAREYEFFLNGGNDATARDLQIGGSVFAIVSGGRPADGETGATITPSDPYTIGTFIATDYDQDIVWGDGYFIRRPGGLGGS